MTIDYQAPIAPERALRYLLKEGYGDLSKILAVARATSGYLYAGLPEKELEQLLQTMYEEDYHTAYKGVAEAYRTMDNAVPKYIQALYSWFPIWQLFMLFVYETTYDFKAEQDKYRTYPQYNEAIKQAFPTEPL